MTVQDAVRTVTVPRQAGPAEPPPLSPPAASPAQVLGRARPWTTDEKQFVFGMAACFGFLTLYIVPLLLLAQHVWT